MMKGFRLTITLSRPYWQCLRAMAVQDIREPENFLAWLICVEARRRGMLTAPYPLCEGEMCRVCGG